jgi:hypothetical protein
VPCFLAGILTFIYINKLHFLVVLATNAINKSCRVGPPTSISQTLLWPVLAQDQLVVKLFCISNALKMGTFSFSNCHIKGLDNGSLVLQYLKFCS